MIDKIVKKFWATPLYLVFFFIVGLGLGYILTQTINLYIGWGFISTDYFFIDIINHEFIFGGY